jgi:putative membrane protein
VNDKLANDRTFLAWLRTGIAVFGLGFVVAKAALIIRPDATRLSGRGVYSGVGVLIVLSGAGLILVGYRQHASVLKILERGDESTRPRWPLAITQIATLGALAISVLIILSR